MLLELSTMKLIIGTILAVSVALMVFVNGVMLLVSPSRWFSMPSWMRLQGTIKRRRDSGWVGELPLRLFGAELVAVILWVGYEFFVRPNSGTNEVLNLDVPSVILRLFLCIGLGVMGALMVLKPRWMFDRYWEPRLVDLKVKIGGERQDVRDHVGISFFIHLISTLGLIAVAAACFLGWVLFR